MYIGVLLSEFLKYLFKMMITAHSPLRNIIVYRENILIRNMVFIVNFTIVRTIPGFENNE